MSDVLIYESDGGEILENDLNITMTKSGIESAVYLSLFAGNRGDSGLVDDKNQWWGNYADSNREYRSELQTIAFGLPIISNSLRKIETASKRDLQWLIDTANVKKVLIDATRDQEEDRVKLKISIILIDEVTIVLEFFVTPTEN